MTPPRRDTPSRATYTRRRVLVAGAGLGIPALALQRLSTDQPPASASATAPTTIAAPRQSTPVAVAPAPDTASMPTSSTQPSTLEPGMVGDTVAQLQQRLVELHFDPGPVDGDFGPATTRAVWAAKKILLDGFASDVDATVTPDTANALAAASPLRPRRSNAGTITHTEIYLPEQVIAVFRDGIPLLVSHMSSGELDADGKPAEWCEIVTIDTDERGNPLPEPVAKDVCGRSKTPGGLFEFTRRVDGVRRGALGSMWNPVYFNYGIAVHGSSTVPNRPASHGCVRIPMHIADYFPSLVDNGDTVLVWNGQEEPELVTDDDRLPVFDYPNPSATTTTTTTTSTTTTTAAPATTVPPAPTEPITPPADSLAPTTGPAGGGG